MLDGQGASYELAQGFKVAEANVELHFRKVARNPALTTVEVLRCLAPVCDRYSLRFGLRLDVIDETLNIVDCAEHNAVDSLLFTILYCYSEMHIGTLSWMCDTGMSFKLQAEGSHVGDVAVRC